MRGIQPSSNGSSFLRAVARRRLVGTRQRVVAISAATALALGAVAWIGTGSAFAASDGAGTMTASPTSVNAAATGVLLSFTFTNNSGSTFNNGSNVTVTVPSGWTAPSSSNGQPGYVTASGSCNSLDTTPSVSGSTITIAQRCTNGQSFTLLYGTGTNSTHVTAPATAGSYTFDTASQDGFSGSHALGSSPTVTVNAGPASQLVFTTQPSGATAGSTWTSQPVVSVEDSHNNVVTTQNTGTVTMSIAAGGPQASFTSGTATANVTSGVATFTNLVVNTAGSYTLTATPGSISGVSSAVNSSAFTVKPAAENKLVVTSQPVGAITAGGTVTVGVTIEDTFGNQITTGNTGSTDTLAVSLTSGSFASGTTSRAAVNGVVSFPGLQINSTSGSPYTIHVIDTSHGSVTATDTNTIAVVAATGAKLIITSASFTSSASTGASNGVTAVLQDQFGNLTTNPSAITVNLASTSSGATFAATSGGSSVTSVLLPANTSSVGFFYGDTVAGSPTVTASGAGLSPNATQVETITAAAANKLAFGQSPTDTTVGVAMSPTVTVQVKDQFGNNVATPVGISVTLTASSGSIDAGAAATTNAAGLATFGGITINTAATGLTLTAASTTPNGSAPSASFNVTVLVSNGAVLTNNATDAGSGVASVSYYYCAGYTGSCTSGTFIGTSTNAGGNFPVTWSGQPGNGAYRIVSVGIDNVTNTSSASASIPVTVLNTQPQTITFTSTAPNAGKAGNTYTPTATATSGLTVTITLDGTSTGCTLVSGVVHFTAAGTCVIDANQAGNALYNPAGQVQQSIPVYGALAITSITSSDSGTITPGSSFETITFNNPLNPATVPATGTMTISLGCFILCANATLTIPGITNGALDTGTSYGAWVAENAFGTNTISYAVTTTLSPDQKSITVTVGNCTANCGNVAAGAAGTYKFKPATSIADVAGNNASGESDMPSFNIF